MILNSSNPFTRNGDRKIAGLRKMLAVVAKIEPEFVMEKRDDRAAVVATQITRHNLSTNFAQRFNCGSAAGGESPTHS